MLLFSHSVCLTLCNPMGCSTPGFPVLHHLLEFAQTDVHRVGDAIQPSKHVVPFSSGLQSFPASRSFPVSWLFTSGGQSIAASASVLAMNFKGWFPLELTSLISFLSKGLSRVFSSTSLKASILQCCFLYSPNLTSVHDYWKNRSFDYMDLCQQSDVLCSQLYIFQKAVRWFFRT